MESCGPPTNAKISQNHDFNKKKWPFFPGFYRVPFLVPGKILGPKLVDGFFGVPGWSDLTFRTAYENLRARGTRDGDSRRGWRQRQKTQNSRFHICVPHDPRARVAGGRRSWKVRTLPPKKTKNVNFFGVSGAEYLLMRACV